MVALRVRVCVCVQSLYFDFHTKNIIFYFRQYVRSVRNVIERDCDRTIVDVIEHSIDLIKFQFAYTFLRSKFSAQFMVMAATPCTRWSCQTFPKQTKTVNYAANWSRTKSCNELVVVRPPVGVKLTNFQRFGYFMIFDLLIFFWFCYDVMLSLCGITYVLRINCVCENMMSSRWSNRKLKKKMHVPLRDPLNGNRHKTTSKPNAAVICRHCEPKTPIEPPKCPTTHSYSSVIWILIFHFVPNQNNRKLWKWNFFFIHFFPIVRMW